MVAFINNILAKLFPGRFGNKAPSGYHRDVPQTEKAPEPVTSQFDEFNEARPERIEQAVRNSVTGSLRGSRDTASETGTSKVAVHVR
mmetsp:Transcript_19531/g.59016  ORF Transcript_19531/g.59016 Transcript_19531/m.59016 type:complete len:87 (-) Transcript_19531:1328-1588(-)